VLVLALEPDPRQAAALKPLVEQRVGAELLLADSKDAAIAALADRVPDLILVTALLSPRDEAELSDHLRTLDNTAHLQTLTIPLLASSAPQARRKRGFLSALRQVTPAAPASGCEPQLFADQIRSYLDRAQELKLEAADAALRLASMATGDTAAHGYADPHTSHAWTPEPPSSGMSGEAPGNGRASSSYWDWDAPAHGEAPAATSPVADESPAAAIDEHPLSVVDASAELLAHPEDGPMVASAAVTLAGLDDDAAGDGTSAKIQDPAATTPVHDQWWIGPADGAAAILQDATSDDEVTALLLAETRELTGRERQAREETERELSVREQATRDAMEREGEARARADRERAARDAAAREHSERERRAREDAEAHRQAREQAERELAERDVAARELVARERAARQEAERERAAHEATARTAADRERAAEELAARLAQEHEERAHLAHEADERVRVAQEQALHDATERERTAREAMERERLAREEVERKLTAREREAREAAERERLAREQAEHEAAERARMAHELEERLAHEQAERQRIAQEAADRERLAREQAERQAAERERASRELAARERAAREQAERELAERLAVEREERERLAQEAIERERLAREEAVREAAERERTARETAERERVAREQAEREAAQREHAAREQAEREAAQREHAAREQAEREAAQREHAAHAAAERERLAREQAERDLADRERVAIELAQQLAGEQAERERLAREVEDRERTAREEAARQRAEHERIAQDLTERLSREQAERERLAREAEHWQTQQTAAVPEPPAVADQGAERDQLMRDLAAGAQALAEAVKATQQRPVTERRPALRAPRRTPRPKKSKPKHPNAPATLQDEWGVYDASVCGFDALYAKLEAQESDDEPQPPEASAADLLLRATDPESTAAVIRIRRGPRPLAIWARRDSTEIADDGRLIAPPAHAPVSEVMAFIRGLQVPAAAAAVRYAAGCRIRKVRVKGKRQRARSTPNTPIVIISRRLLDEAQKSGKVEKLKSLEVSEQVKSEPRRRREGHANAHQR
jgi:hypothetical protein